MHGDCSAVSAKLVAAGLSLEELVRAIAEEDEEVEDMLTDEFGLNRRVMRHLEAQIQPGYSTEY